MHVKFLGGAKKTFPTGEITIDDSDLTIHTLLDLLKSKKPLNTPKLDVNNLLIAVNGVDSSALDGKNTQLHDNDVISIIPVIHGGSNSRTQFQINKMLIEIFEINFKSRLNVDFLDNLRNKFPNLILQGIETRFVLGKSHAKKIIQISLKAKKNQAMLSKKLEIDILMRFACTTQISKAIQTAGIKPRKNFLIMALGSKLILNMLNFELIPHLNSKIISTNNSAFIKKQFKISKKQIDSVTSSSPLEDILAEKAAILFH